jgi:hypothetical protein
MDHLMRFVMQLLGMALAVLFFACGRSPDDDMPWGLPETRRVVTTLQAVPTLTDAEGAFAVLVPLGLDRQRLALSAAEDLVLGRGATVSKPTLNPHLVRHGVVSSMGDLTIEGDVAVGAAYALGKRPPRVEGGAVVDGYVRCTGEDDQIGPGTVRLGVLKGQKTAIEVFTWRVEFPPETRGSRFSRAEDTAVSRVEPGAYSDVMVGAGSRAAIRTGTYFVNRLQVDDGGTLEIDNTNGPVYVWVRDAFEMHGTMQEDFPDGNVLFGYAGSKPVAMAAFRGTLVAPAASLVLQAGPSGNSGAFFASRIVVEPHGVVEHRPFVLGLPRSPAFRASSK